MSSPLSCLHIFYLIVKNTHRMKFFLTWVNYLTFSVLFFSLFFPSTMQKFCKNFSSFSVELTIITLKSFHCVDRFFAKHVKWCVTSITDRQKKGLFMHKLGITFFRARIFLSFALNSYQDRFKKKRFLRRYKTFHESGNVSNEKTVYVFRSFFNWTWFRDKKRVSIVIR